MREADARLPPRLLAAVAAAIAVAFVALGLSEPWHRVELKGFDALTVATARNASSFPITVVGIDEASFAQLRLQWPWPRSLHAKLLDELAKAGAAVVAFDMQLSEADRGGPAEDAALAKSIAAHGGVILASDMVYVESAHARQWMRVDPLEAFTSAGALPGFARIELDRDLVARRMPLEGDAFWRQVAKALARAHPEIRVEEPRAGAMIRYAGPILTFQYVSYYQALEPSKLPQDVFRDQVVIVGRHVQASPDAGAAQSDVFSTPFTAATGWFTPGPEIHAHILETALRGDAVYPLGATWSGALVALMALLSAALMRRWRPLWSGLTALALVAAVGALDWVLFARFDVWLPSAGAAAAGIASVYLAYGALAFLQEQRRRAEIRRAFGLYVSPEVVDHVMAKRARLQLGGERRDVTMLFTDLAGFTPLTEQLGAEQVAHILNRHFTGATRIIKRHGGTVNRFIGDAIMAMWGAPLDDPRHARNACLAACAMQEDIARLREELRAQGLPEIRMRIGIHSGNVIVGNLGSDDRFDYTAIGDPVNLAARLEGVNKLYGTGILVSGDTVALLGGTPRMRPVDEVVVKGKSQPVQIFTPCEDEAVVDLTVRALAAYRARRWAESEALWRQLPGDGVAAVYLERIAACRERPPEASWRGVVELEKL